MCALSNHHHQADQAAFNQTGMDNPRRPTSCVLEGTRPERYAYGWLHVVQCTVLLYMCDTCHACCCTVWCNKGLTSVTSPTQRFQTRYQSQQEQAPKAVAEMPDVTTGPTPKHISCNLSRKQSHQTNPHVTIRRIAEQPTLCLNSTKCIMHLAETRERLSSSLHCVLLQHRLA